MNIQSSKCHIPKSNWGPTYDVSKSLPETAGEGPTVSDLGTAIDSYVAQSEAGGSVEGLHPYCAGVDSSTAIRASEYLKYESEQMQELFSPKQGEGEQKLLAAQDVADTLGRHAVEFEQASASAAEKAETMATSAKKSLSVQLGLSLLAGGASAALAFGVQGVPGWIPAVIGGAAILGGFDAGLNLMDEDLGSRELQSTRHQVKGFANEAQTSRDMSATAQAWVDHLKK